MKTLLAATPNCLVYDDGEPLGNRASTLGTLLFPKEVEWAPGRGGVVLNGTRISVGQIFRQSTLLGLSPGYIAGCYGLDERDIQAVLSFCELYPECVEPEDEDAPWWLDGELSEDR